MFGYTSALTGTDAHLYGGGGVSKENVMTQI